MSDIITFPGNLASAPDINALRALDSDFLEPNVPIILTGGASSGDGLGGVYVWAAASVAADNGTTIIRPLDRTPLMAGRWISVSASLVLRVNKVIAGNEAPATAFPNYVGAATIGGYATDGNYGITGFSQTSVSTNTGGQSCIGASGFVLNDNATQLQTAYAGYFEARRYPGASTTHGVEINPVNLGSVLDFSPISGSPGITPGLWLSSGRGDVPGCVNTTCAIGVITNGTTNRRGIVFANNALDGTFNEAMSMVDDYHIQWYDAAGPTSIIAGKVMAGFVRSSSTQYTFNFTRARNGGADTQIGDALMEMNFYKYASASGEIQARIVPVMAGTDRGGLSFYAVNDAGDQVSVGINTAANNNFGPDNSDNALTCGSASTRWSVVYAGTGAINTSDERTKRDIAPVDPRLLAAARNFEIVQYRFIDGQRLHTGVIAQQVKAAMEAEGLDPFAYGFLGQDPWMEPVVEYEDEEVEVTEEIEVPTERIEMIDGKMVRILGTKLEARTVYDVVPVHDEDGNPIVEPAVPATSVTRPDGQVMTHPGRPERPLTSNVPRTQTVSKPKTVQRQKLDDDGNPMFLMSIRPDELNFLLMAARA